MNPERSIILLPFMAGMWAIDLYLSLLGCRLLLSQAATPKTRQMHECLRGLTEPLLAAVGHGLKRRGYMAAWLPWAIVVAGGLLGRVALAALLMGF